jgi:hypothetical protein
MDFIKIALQELYLIMVSPVTHAKKRCKLLGINDFKKVFLEQIENKKILKKGKKYYISYQSITDIYSNLQSLEKKDTYHLLAFYLIFTTIGSFILILLWGSVSLANIIAAPIIALCIVLFITALIHSLVTQDKQTRTKSKFSEENCYTNTGLTLDDCLHYFEYVTQNILDKKVSNVNTKNTFQIRNIKNDILIDEKDHFELCKEIHNYLFPEYRGKNSEYKLDIKTMVAEFPYKNYYVELSGNTTLHMTYFIVAVMNAIFEEEEVEECENGD